MPQRNRWMSVCHSTAQHAASGLCPVHPHLGRLLRSAGEHTARVDLLRDAPAPRRLSGRYHLDTALRALKRRFTEIVRSDGLDPADLAQADLLLEFPLESDDHCRAVHAKLSSRDGRVFVRAVDHLGAQVAQRSDF
jgi:hypothetical protein